MERATVNRRTLSTEERRNLKANVAKLAALQIERRGASHLRRQELELEIRRLNAACEAIIQ